MTPILSVCTILFLSGVGAAFPSAPSRPPTKQVATSGLSPHKGPSTADAVISSEERPLDDHKLFTDSLTSPPRALHSSYEHDQAKIGDAPPFPSRQNSSRSMAKRARRRWGPTSSPQLAINNDRTLDSSSHRLPPAGTIYQPGTYPTPDLLLVPISKSALLLDPPSHTSDAIQQALDSLGPYSILYLPPRTRWVVRTTIHLQPYQELATMDYPDDEEEIAWLEADEDCTGNLLSGANTPGVRIRNVGFDGGMEKYGPSKESQAMVQLGNSRGFNQVIDRCIVRHPRGWSSVQVYDGGENVRVTNNRVGPAGYDETTMGRGYWADGISYAGLNGLVAGNIVTDATDGGIVIFGAPGTLVTSNTVITRTRMASGAINLVDRAPYQGNYAGTSVIHNTIRMEGAYLGIGVAQGPAVWWLPKPNKSPTYNYGAVVKFNLLTAAPNTTSAVGYGFAVSDVDDWTCINNEVSANVVFEGDMSGMPREPRLVSLPPGPFVRTPSRDNSGPTRSLLQDEFVQGPIHRLLAIRPGEPTYRAFLPGRLTLAFGEAVLLKRVKLSFDSDGELRLSSDGDAGEAILWEAGCKDRVGMREDSKLVFDSSGSLGIVSSDGEMLCPLVPYLQLGIQDLVLELSSERPHLFLASSATGSVYWSPTGYEVGHQWKAEEGSFICLTTPDSRTVFLSGVNALGQYVILRSVGDVVVPAALPWPVRAEDWQVEWKSHEVDSDEPDHGSYIFFQDDGNLVLYSGTTGLPLWTTATDEGHSLVTSTRWSLDPLRGLAITCIARDGAVVWNSASAPDAEKPSSPTELN